MDCADRTVYEPDPAARSLLERLWGEAASESGAKT